MQVRPLNKELKRVERAAAKAAVARSALEAEVKAAHVAGQSLRAIGAAAGVSHEQVRKMLG